MSDFVIPPGTVGTPFTTRQTDTDSDVDPELLKYAREIGRASVAAADIEGQAALADRGYPVNQRVIDQACASLNDLYRLGRVEPQLLTLFRDKTAPLFELNKQRWRVVLTNDDAGSGFKFVVEPPRAE